MKQIKLWMLAAILTICGFLNVGDIHSCEPWLYSECLQRNIKVRAKEWRKIHQPTVTRIQERGKLQVGTTGDYRPLSYREGADF